MALDPVVSTIVVPCDRQTAFEIFTEDMASWWPLDKRSMSVKQGKRVEALHVDARLGGQIVELSEDGTEYLWGTYRVFDPYTSVTLDFHMGMPPSKASTVEVVFTARGEARTEVVLSQSNWEAFGDLAEMMRNGYGSSWVLIFDEGFGELCRRRAQGEGAT